MTDVFRLKHIGLLFSCGLCLRVDNTYFLLCSVWVELCANLTSGLI